MPGSSIIQFCGFTCTIYTQTWVHPFIFSSEQNLMGPREVMTMKLIGNHLCCKDAFLFVIFKKAITDVFKFVESCWIREETITIYNYGTITGQIFCYTDYPSELCTLFITSCSYQTIRFERTYKLTSE
jgi:hypothetical protein